MPGWSVTENRRDRTQGSWTAPIAAALLLILGACATADVDDGNGRLVALPDEWDTIDIGEADLDLPLGSPYEIDELRQRVGAYQLFENLYTFHGVNGFLITSRVFFGEFARNPSLEVRDEDDFLRFARSLPAVESRRLTVGSAKRFGTPDKGSTGYYTKAISDLRHEDCFIFRFGYHLVDYSSFDSDPDSIDTIVTGQLCGDDLDEAALLTLLADVKVVEDREHFRKALSRSKIGTI